MTARSFRVAPLVALVAALVLAPGTSAQALPGDGGDGRCDGRVATTAERAAADFEVKIGLAQQLRTMWGMPSDRALVERLLADPGQAGVVARYSAPLAADEARYVDSRWELNGLGSPVTRYFEQHAPGVAFEMAIVDDFPRDAYFAVYGGPDLERHAGALAAISTRIRVLGALPSELLEQARQRVVSGRAQLAREGIHVHGVGVSALGVGVLLVSSRPDAVSVVERRLGPHVRAEVTGTRFSYRACISADGYWTSDRGRTLHVAWETGRNRLISIRARETANAVRVRLIERRSDLPSIPIAVYRKKALKLRRPLGARPVIDAETGKRLKTLGGRNPLRRVSRRRAR